MKVLITCGPTWVPIDDVRVISNVSSGEMGHLIAEQFLKAGAQVTVIEGAVTHSLQTKGIKVIKYKFFDELAAALKEQLKKKYDVVIHAAAVSDFKVEKLVKGKINSTKALSLKLTPTIKLINLIKKIDPKTCLVGFKLESSLATAIKDSRKLHVQSGCDVVVANTWNKGYQAAILNADNEILFKTNNKEERSWSSGKIAFLNYLFTSLPLTSYEIYNISPDGLADEPLMQLGGKTPLEAANTPNMDYLAQRGMSGLVQTIPEGMPPGSDIGNLALLGYDPKKNFSGRAPLEAANMGVMLKDDEVAFRCNLITAENGIMKDYSAGHIASEEAKHLIEFLERAIDWPDVRFYPGKSYRHLMVLKTINVARMTGIKTTPPHDILNQPLSSYLPSGPQSETLLLLMEKSKDLLANHPVNRVRMDLGENPANMIWLWGQGCRPQLPFFKDRYGLTGSVISAVDLVNGIGRLIGLKVVNVPGANGYYDTNYKGKAEYALESLKDHDFVYVHVEATDEAGHNGDWKAKTECCERFDKEVVGTILNHFGKGDDVRILVSPDHPTPVAKRTHTNAAVPFIMYGSGVNPNGVNEYSEAAAAKIGLKFKSGEEMVQYFLKRG